MNGVRKGGRAGTVLLMSGGVALGAFEAGVCEVLDEQGPPGWVLGVSSGAVNAAIVAGNPPGRRAEALRRFWMSAADEPMPWTSFWLGPPPAEGAWRRAYNEMAAIRALTLGRPGVFSPRLLQSGTGAAPALYDLEPMSRHLPECVDFDLLNSPAAPRLTLVATDVESGERVVFDTARGARIGPGHVLASCALLPVFAPMEVEGRLLGDGGLASNLPLDLLLAGEEAGERLAVLVDLFAERGSRPRSLGASIARAGDLAFGNQTLRMIEAAAREYGLRDLLRRLVERLPPGSREDAALAALLAEAEREGNKGALTLLRLGYRASLDEAGPGKLFDFSRATLQDRWRAGAAAARAGLDGLGAAGSGRSLAPGLTLHDVEG
ncbi:patatin-like phospholipase family protein [Roseomonas sp. GCM10028921]